MSRKKLKIIIITLSVFFFTVSSTVNYINMYRIVRSDLREYPNNITDITEDILNRDDGLYEKLKASDVSVTDYMAFMADNCMGKMPHQTAVLDADGNILSVGGTAVFIDSVFAENKHCWLINLEEYMTSSLREEISHFIYFNSSADVKYFSFYRSEGKYIPVEMRLEDRTTKKEKSFYFTDNKADKTFNANLYNIGFNLWGERERFYEKG